MIGALTALGNEMGMHASYVYPLNILTKRAGDGKMAIYSLAEDLVSGNDYESNL